MFRESHGQTKRSAAGPLGTGLFLFRHLPSNRQLRIVDSLLLPDSARVHQEHPLLEVWGQQKRVVEEWLDIYAS